jgi:hypothetical protein
VNGLVKRSKGGLDLIDLGDVHDFIRTGAADAEH